MVVTLGETKDTLTGLQIGESQAIKKGISKIESDFKINEEKIGAFKNKETALGIQNGLTQTSAFIVEKNVNGVILNCVQVGGLKTKEEALIMLDKIKSAGYPDARIMTK